MKVRNGFVSNSSSSSFIIKTEKDLEICKKYNINTYKVSDLILNYNYLIRFDNSLQITDRFPSFLRRDILCVEDLVKERLQELKDLEAQYPDSYITEEYDRDYAYELKFDFDLFEGDL